MTDDIRAVFSPLLIISYIFGTRIIEFPMGQPRLCYSFLYILLVWSFYHILLAYTILNYIQSTSIVFQICFWMNTFTALLSVILGIYHDKKFRSCLKKLAMVDNTLKKIGVMYDYHKSYQRILWTIIAWLVSSLWRTYSTALWHGTYCNDMNSFFVGFMLEYASYVNLLNDLIITGTLRYIELKFDEIHEHLWEHFDFNSRPTKYLKSTNNEFLTWIVIHLYLELRQISHDLNSIIGLQMTAKMGVYFALIALGFRELFNVLMVNNYERKGILHLILAVTFLVMITFRLFSVHYMCEKVSKKAIATGDIISKISYSPYDVVIRENISQFLLQIHLVPLKFYGLGFFEFGLKFLRGFCASVTTVIVILVQSHTNTENE